MAAMTRTFALMIRVRLTVEFALCNTLSISPVPPAHLAYFFKEQTPPEAISPAWLGQLRA